MREIITAENVNLSLWNVQIDGSSHDPHGNPTESTFLLCYYFNIGLDARVGYNVERMRTGRRCCNYILYVAFGLYDYFAGFCKRGHENPDQQIARVVAHKERANGYIQKQVKTEMKHLNESPVNIVGANLPQGYGGFLNTETWGRSKDKIADKGKRDRPDFANQLLTSCDEDDHKLEQRYDDDKMELMC